MAYIKAPILAVTMVVILLVAENPVADFFDLQINARGKLCCTASGSCSGRAPGVPGVMVMMNCSNPSGTTVTVGQGITDASGYFNISVHDVELGRILSNLGILPCVATVNLPLNQKLCPVLFAATGILKGSLNSVRSVISTVLGQHVANFMVSTFDYMPQLPV